MARVLTTNTHTHASRTQAKPRFLTDETDPGAAAWGTGKFVDAVQKYHTSRGSAEEKAAMTELEQWKPESESAAGWAAYVEGLLGGANGEPFYAPQAKKEIEGAFFEDSEVLRMLDDTYRKEKCPGKTRDFLQVRVFDT